MEALVDVVVVNERGCCCLSIGDKRAAAVKRNEDVLEWLPLLLPARGGQLLLGDDDDDACSFVLVGGSRLDHLRTVHSAAAAAGAVMHRL